MILLVKYIILLSYYMSVIYLYVQQKTLNHVCQEGRIPDCLKSHSKSEIVRIPIHCLKQILDFHLEMFDHLDSLPHNEGHQCRQFFILCYQSLIGHTVICIKRNLSRKHSVSRTNN